MTHRRPFTAMLPWALWAGAIAVTLLLSSGKALVWTPSVLFWVTLCVFVTLVPVRRFTGTQGMDLISLMTFTVLVLFGTGTAVLSGLAVGVASGLSSPSGNRRARIRRAALDSGIYAASLGCAALVVWGTRVQGGAADAGLDHLVVVKLPVAYALYLSVRGILKSVSFESRRGRSLLQPRAVFSEWSPVSTWLIPPAAYLLALVYLDSSLLTVTLMASLMLIQGIAVAEERRCEGSWVRLTDGIRQACDGHVMKHRSETQGTLATAMMLGRKMKLPPRNLSLLKRAAALHNVGYIALDSGLVLRPGDLTPEEICAVRQHPESSREILSRVEGMGDAAEIVRYHHESPDGTGYPCGLKGDAIPIEAAIVKVAEAFTAMTSPRLYRGKTLSRDQALEEIAGAVGTSFDPAVAYYLFQTMGRTDLASAVSRTFGAPDKRRIAGRLRQVTSSQGPDITPPRARWRQSVGLSILGASVVAVYLLDNVGWSRMLAVSPLRPILDPPTAVFLIALLGLAVAKPARLGDGACCSWGSAVVLYMVLAGGPVYVAICGAAMTGWTLVFRSSYRPGSTPGAPHRRDSNAGAPGQGTGRSAGVGAGYEEVTLEPLRTHDRIFARIDRYNRGCGNPRGLTYCLAVTLAAACTWIVSWLGQSRVDGGIVGLVLSPVLLLATGVTVFYVLETRLQAALLSGHGRSASRFWYADYASAFPEPLTYAIFGCGAYLLSELAGNWTAILIFTLPVIWRHSILVRRTETLRTTRGLVRSIAGVVDSKDGNAGHASSVATTAVAMARKMRKSEAFVEELESAALLHDIGKASWPNKVLLRSTPSTGADERYRYFHPDMSAEIAAWAGYSESVAEMIRSHHEHYDGSGFMRGLKHDRIPLGGRILCAADAFVSMIQAGDARFRRTLAETVREMRFDSGSKYDPEVVKALLDVINSVIFGRAEAPLSETPADITEGIGAAV